MSGIIKRLLITIIAFGIPAGLVYSSYLLGLAKMEGRDVDVVFITFIGGVELFGFLMSFIFGAFAVYFIINLIKWIITGTDLQGRKGTDMVYPKDHPLYNK